MNKIIGIIGLTLMFSACGDTSDTSHSTEPTKKLTKEEVVLGESIKQIDAIEKDIQVKEVELDKALEELKGM